MKNFKFLSTLLVFVIGLCFTSCSSSSDEIDNGTVYRIGFTKVSTSSLDETSKIAESYRTAIGVTTDEFKLDKADDKRVKECCKKADESLKSTEIKGSYTLVVSRGLLTIWEASYGK